VVQEASLDRKQHGYFTNSNVRVSNFVASITRTTTISKLLIANEFQAVDGNTLQENYETNPNQYL